MSEDKELSSKESIDEIESEEMKEITEKILKLQKENSDLTDK